MLQNVKAALKELYYDPTYRGMNLDERFKAAERDINAAKSSWQINAIIAQVLLDLDDSHTSFHPPDLVVGVRFGFKMQMIGGSCFVVEVKPGTNAEAKGLKVGDLVYAIEGFEPTRESLWKIEYSYFTLLPPPALRVTVQDSGGKLRDLVINAAVSNEKRKKIKVTEARRSKTPPKYFDLNSDTIICKLRRFDLSDKEVDDMMQSMMTRKTLIIDMRGNPGGYVAMEQRLLGYFFDRDVKIGDEKRRKQTSARIAKTRGDKVFKGKVIVLVDSRSGSAAEIFARIIQLEKRGTVIGDRTAGAVMTSVSATFSFVTAADWQAMPSSFYGVSITVADLIMTDGKSLEKVGIAPDEIVLPTAADIAGKRDPVLARAAALAGVELDAAKAGTIFSAEPSDDDDDKPGPDDK